MHRFFRNSFFAVAAVIATGSVSAFAAQDPNAANSATAPAAAPKAKPAHETSHHAMVESRIVDLHTRLQISVAQQVQWDAFIQVMRDNASSMDQSVRQRSKTLTAMTAAENMQSYAQITMNHAQDMQKLVPTFQALYDTMSATQKKAADRVFREDAARHTAPDMARRAI